jgi:hypothetical protein
MTVLLMTVWSRGRVPPNLLLQCSEVTAAMDLAIATDLAEGGSLMTFKLLFTGFCIIPMPALSLQQSSWSF